MRLVRSFDMPMIRNCFLPEELFYDVERDLWARVDGDGILLGLTDVGQSRSGEIQVVSFTRRAQAGPIKCGESVAVLESAKWVGPITSPVTGVVAETNQALLARPRLVNLEPYGRGWIVRLRPDQPTPEGLDGGHWTSGAVAVRRYEAKLREPFRSVAGVDEDFWCVHCSDWDE